ncbi:hypothetical protein GMD78_12395 [Ornithinibacillus sp. L9]|uniref:Uncharacterized protein n=1 Tax=Ornithinibacillus caprae TaxID=2678566 RepID=A0A6N8FIB6_9BACI|nr:hypothetical protein [Ornithinibacillus caprae]MUK89173.1 hypothetical protein [Ornithinibacillus caprae]
MIIKLNGKYWFDTNEEQQEMVFVQKSNKLKQFAIALWTSTGVLFAQTVRAESFYENMRPLEYTFQDIALGLGILSALAGFILLGIKKRWGVTTLKTTALVVGGVFLVPSILMLIAIVGTMLNEALTDAFQNVRDMKDVMGE